ncbi:MULTISPECIES: SpoVR family protein [unclassified Mesorhizobium]|uniref:SpoVR family protein n=1 Tax=unclassified Mesorhizobium TaxID=325217 RepID=UPI001092B4D2|nr:MULTISPECIES: SpoVR family protein [unclassified Mesorhizobium]TGP86276.1 SpoVR family protein [Mesorhizobium sp. M8A.F.Ca.ET.218.01.1.1]TGS38652.1 SpoVR family protein [Mesorhizobium sp. M8A.F.Ca.ET.182.01.1.1]TGS77148.1 SpoVR family protein [Mesorhizobium sp. M8A.F.Ca.ET.181.01.1.1]TGT15059.1 SpoVR family protein [Mesorhizobium sp. M8A.F.Ca.ET.213.01.1.1]TGT88558.1 SpoVR family protein [Mesorhizobium sp. M8A.F.Ca.ET.161.01.1.1]
MATQAANSELLFSGSDWDFTKLSRVYDAIEAIAVEELHLDIYPVQMEIISSQQMLDAYSSVGMPLMYRHWSFGKHFLHQDLLYRKGGRGLAYELVINSNPCIVYLMEENTMALQALVTAHAALGHNHFFKNNHLFKQWTDAGAILGYLDFAKSYIVRCEERHGLAAVEAVLDSAHALMEQGVFRYQRPPKLSSERLREGLRERLEYEERSYNDLWRTLPHSQQRADVKVQDPEWKKSLNLPEENLLYFLEKNSPVLEPWQREIIRIVRVIAQYFYPQRQTQVMNEGCATFVHYTVMNTLFDRGRISEGAMLEILRNHSNVVFQPAFDDPRFSGINPYALGLDMMQDIRRISTKPTAEDRDWFPDIAGHGNWREVLLDAWADHRDESFIRQYLSPALIRKWRFFVLGDAADQPHCEVASIHNERGYEKIRAALAHNYDVGANRPDIQVVDVDLLGDRHLRLQHKVKQGILLEDTSRDATLRHIRRLWGYEVSLAAVDAETGLTVHERSTSQIAE